jgi:hypothetical protein
MNNIARLNHRKNSVAEFQLKAMSQYSGLELGYKMLVKR